jgi:putative addiction module component (TIGR02574 family)
VRRCRVDEPLAPTARSRTQCRVQTCYDVAVAALDMLNELLRLPASDRARLALELIRSLDEEPDADAASAWDAEIERRGAEVDAGTAETMTLEEYRAHARQRRLARARR